MRIYIVLLVFVALAACSNTRSPRGAFPPEETFRGGPNAMLLKYDANHDGSVSRAELDAGLHAEFDRYDTGHAGCLNPDQVAAINAERIKQDQSAATPLQDFQANGCVDFQEYAAAAVSLFQELDRNGDGVVTAQEFNPRPNPNGPGARVRREQGPPGGP